MTKKKIIWVDDDLQLISSLRQMFFDNGFLIESCQTLTEAHSKLKSNYTNNLLIDVEFPNSKKEGIIFLENIVKEFPNLKAIIFTGFPESDDAVQVIRKKLAADYIQKGNLNSKDEIKSFFDRLHKIFLNNKVLETQTEKPPKKKILTPNPVWYVVILALLAFLFGQNQLEGCFSNKNEKSPNTEASFKTKKKIDTLKLDYLKTHPILDNTINVSNSFNYLRIGGINKDSLQINGMDENGNQASFSLHDEYLETNIHNRPILEIRFKNKFYKLKIEGKINNYKMIITELDTSSIHLKSINEM